MSNPAAAALLPQPLPVVREMFSLPLRRYQAPPLSEEGAEHTSKVMDFLEKKLKERKLVIDQYPFYQKLKAPMRSLDFSLTIMKLAPQSGKTYLAAQIGLGEGELGGMELDEVRCQRLYLSAMTFLFDIVKTRFSNRWENPDWMIEIQKHHDNRCFITNMLLTNPLVKGPPRLYEQPGLDTENSPRIMPLLPMLSTEENHQNFWNFASNTTGHPEWLEQYGNAKTIDKDPSKCLLLQKSVATEFSRFKFAVGLPKKNKGCKLFHTSLRSAGSDIDVHAPKDPTLPNATGKKTISSTRYEKCDKDLLELHLFLFKLLDNSIIRTKWILDESWNELGYERAQSLDYDSEDDPVSLAEKRQAIKERAASLTNWMKDEARYNEDHGMENLPKDYSSDLWRKLLELEAAHAQEESSSRKDIIADLGKKIALLERLVETGTVEAKAHMEAQAEAQAKEDAEAMSRGAGIWE